MARNPTVDGITNIAIPDALYGVYMRGHTVAGSLFGIMTEVCGDINLDEMVVSGNVRFNGMCVSETVYLRSMVISGYADFSGIKANNVYLNNTRTSADVDFSNMHALNFFDLSGMRVIGNVYCDDVRIGTLELNRKSPISIDGRLDLSGAVIPVLSISGDGSDSPLRVKSYKINEKTKIPDELMTILSQYKRIE